MKRKLLGLVVALCMVFTCVSALAACASSVDCEVDVKINGGGDYVTTTEENVVIDQHSENATVIVAVAEGYDHRLVTATYNGNPITGVASYDGTNELTGEIDFTQTRNLIYTLTNSDNRSKAELVVDASRVKLVTVRHALNSEARGLVKQYAIVKDYDGESILTALTDDNAEVADIPEDGVIAVPYGTPFFLMSDEERLVFGIEFGSNTLSDSNIVAAQIYGRHYVYSDKYLYPVYAKCNGSEISFDRRMGSSYNAFADQDYSTAKNVLTIVAPTNGLVENGGFYRDVTETGGVGSITINFPPEDTVSVSSLNINSALWYKHGFVYVGSEASAEGDPACAMGVDGNNIMDIDKVPNTAYIIFSASKMSDNVTVSLTNGTKSVVLPTGSASLYDESLLAVYVDKATALQFVDSESNSGVAWLDIELDSEYDASTDDVVRLEVEVTNDDYDAVLRLNPQSSTLVNGSRNPITPEFIETNELALEAFYFTRDTLNDGGLSIELDSLIDSEDLDIFEARFATGATVAVKKADGTQVFTTTVNFTLDFREGRVATLIPNGSTGSEAWSDFTDSHYIIEVTYAQSEKDTTSHRAAVTVESGLTLYYTDDFTKPVEQWSSIVGSGSISLKPNVPMFFNCVDSDTAQKVFVRVSGYTVTFSETSFSYLLSSDFTDLLGNPVQSEYGDVDYLVLGFDFLKPEEMLNISIIRLN